MFIMKSKTLVFVLFFFCLIQASCATQKELYESPDENMKQILEYEKRLPELSQSELDEYTYLWHERQGFKSKYSMTGKAAIAISVAYQEFLRQGLLEEDDEFSKRLVTVSDEASLPELEKYTHGKKNYFVYFHPRYVSMREIPYLKNTYTAGSHWYYPLTTYVFLINAESFEVTHFQAMPH